MPGSRTIAPERDSARAADGGSWRAPGCGARTPSRAIAGFEEVPNVRPRSGRPVGPRSADRLRVPAQRTGAEPRGTATPGATGTERTDVNAGRRAPLRPSQLTTWCWTNPWPKNGVDTTVHAGK